MKSIDIDFNGSLITLRNDIEEMKGAVSSAYALGGSSMLNMLGEAIRIKVKQPDRRSSTIFPKTTFTGLEFMKKDPAECFHDLYKGARTELWLRQIEQLCRIEESAITIIQRRLAVSRAQVRADAERYLIGFDGKKLFADPQKPLKFPSAQLSNQEALKNLKNILKKIYDLKKERAILINAQYYASRMNQPQYAFNFNEQIVELENLIHVLGQKTPILHWLGGMSPDNDEDLLKGIIRELEKTWNSALAVESRINERPASILKQDKISLEQGTIPPAERLASLIKIITESEFNPEDTRYLPLEYYTPIYIQVDKRGPWAFPRIITEAMEELGIDNDSVETTTVEEVFRNVPVTGISFSESIALNLLVTALHVYIPPLALLGDILIGVYEVGSELNKYDRDSTDFRATWDPAEALTLPPSFVPVFTAILGALPFIPDNSKIFVQLVGEVVGQTRPL